MNCSCQSIFSVFMLLGMYNFGNRLDIFLTWIDFQFQYLGNISMSLYLIHEALLRWMIFACRGSVSWSNLSPEDFGSNLPIPQTISVRRFLPTRVVARLHLREFHKHTCIHISEIFGPFNIYRVRHKFSDTRNDLFLMNWVI